MWGSPAIDLMALGVNFQLLLYFFRSWDPQTLAQGALLTPWNFNLVYVFSLLPLILKVLLKIQREKVWAIIILPFQPRRPWFMLAWKMKL